MTNLGFRLLPSVCLLLIALASGPVHAATAIRSAVILDDGKAHPDFAEEPDPRLIDRAFPFCPTDRTPCDESELAWLQLRISIDAYSARRNDPHNSIARILATTRNDLVPLVVALSEYFSDRQVDSDVQRVAFVHGLVQSVNYEKDQDATGWTDYPKFALEFLVDEQGDCDDAAILTTLLLDALGYRSYFVYWKGSPVDHLSTAIEPTQGDLQGFAPPPGSRWVEMAGLPRLLHVDGTGTLGGCGQAWINCHPIGFNEWHKKGLRVAIVVRPGDSDLETRLRLSAWSSGGLERPNPKLFDRRSAPEEEIRSEVFDPIKRSDRLRRRLKSMGFDEERATVYLQRVHSPWKFYLSLTLSLGTMASIAAYVWYKHRQRLLRVLATRSHREAENF